MWLLKCLKYLELTITILLGATILWIHEAFLVFCYCNGAYCGVVSVIYYNIRVKLYFNFYIKNQSTANTIYISLFRTWATSFGLSWNIDSVGCWLIFYVKIEIHTPTGILNIKIVKLYITMEIFNFDILLCSVTNIRIHTVFCKYNYSPYDYFIRATYFGYSHL
jgi:hypothetical protein